MEKYAFNIHNAVKIGSYDEVDKIDAETITKVKGDTAVLDGLIIRAYETRFGPTNENGERYTKECLDDFIERYYIKNRLNMPLTVQHQNDLDHLAGRVLVCEVNSVGFYFVCYIPRTYKHYDEIKNLLREGVLQGLSKEGWCEEADPHWNEDTGELDYWTIKKMDILAMSLVSTPANGVPFEKMQETKNALAFIKKNKKERPGDQPFESFFDK